jgi:hypothetical protein
MTDIPTDIPTDVDKIFDFVKGNVAEAGASELAALGVAKILSLFGAGSDPDTALLEQILMNQQIIESKLDALSLNLDFSTLQIEGFEPKARFLLWTNQISDLKGITDPTQRADRIAQITQAILDENEGAEVQLLKLDLILLGSTDIGQPDGQFKVLIKKLAADPMSWYEKRIGPAYWALQDFADKMLNLQYLGIWLLMNASVAKNQTEVGAQIVKRAANAILAQRTLLDSLTPPYWRTFGEAEGRNADLKTGATFQIVNVADGTPLGAHKQDGPPHNVLVTKGDSGSHFTFIYRFSILTLMQYIIQGPPSFGGLIVIINVNGTLNPLLLESTTDEATPFIFCVIPAEDPTTDHSVLFGATDSGGGKYGSWTSNRDGLFYGVEEESLAGTRFLLNPVGGARSLLVPEIRQVPSKPTDTNAPQKESTESASDAPAGRLKRGCLSLVSLLIITALTLVLFFLLST